MVYITYRIIWSNLWSTK